LNEQLRSVLDVQVTFAVPGLKNDPDGGTQLTVPQVPDVVGE
jgi:hypothetical protein